MGCASSKKQEESAVAPPTGLADTATATAADTEPAVTATAKEAADGQTDSDISDQACFGAGCYWGTEKYFLVEFCRRRFPEAMIKGKVGFMGPKGCKPNPTYREVCDGNTGYVEVFQFTYKGGAEMYREIVKFFFQFHDPSILNAQGNDTGASYASVIFAYDDKQRAIAEEIIAELKAHVKEGRVTCYKQAEVTTAIMDSNEFFPAHDEHQEYLANNPNGYCNHRIRLKEWPTAAQT